MLMGHYAAALVAKAARPRLPLGLLFLAAQWVDVWWSIFVLLGVEHVRIVPGITAATPLDLYHMPYSHSLVAALGWSALLGAVAFFATRERWTAAVVVTLTALSHWLLDFVAHRPDMTLVPGGRSRGLGVWNSVPLTLAVEIGGYFLALLLYLRATRPDGGRGRLGPWLLFFFLVAIQLGGIFGPPPPSPVVVALAGLLGFPLAILLAHLVDRRRLPA